jgi:hypothetical protein
MIVRADHFIIRADHWSMRYLIRVFWVESARVGRDTTTWVRVNFRR